MLKDSEKQKLKEKIVMSLRDIYNIDKLLDDFKQEFVKISDQILNSSEYSEGLEYILSKDPDLVNLTSSVISFLEINKTYFLDLRFQIGNFNLPKVCLSVIVDEHEELKNIKKKFEENWKLAVKKKTYICNFIDSSDIDLKTLKKYSPKLYKLFNEA